MTFEIATDEPATALCAGFGTSARSLAPWGEAAIEGVGSAVLCLLSSSSIIVACFVAIVVSPAIPWIPRTLEFTCLVWGNRLSRALVTVSLMSGLEVVFTCLSRLPCFDSLLCGTGRSFGAVMVDYVY